MEFVIAGFFSLFVVLVGFYCMRESDETKRRKEFAAERIKRMQEERVKQAEAEYVRQAHKHTAPARRSAPITTGKPVDARVTTRVADIKRRDNSFDNDVDTYSAPAYTPSHSTSSYSSHSCSSSSNSSSDSSSSSSDSGGGGCD